MAMTTKKDLSERNQALEEQVSHLQTELTEKSLLLHDANARMDAVEQVGEDAEEVHNLLHYERGITEELTDSLDVLARQFTWSLSMFSTILLYPPEDTVTRRTLLETLQGETSGFMANLPSFNAVNLTKRIEQGRQMMADRPSVIYDATDTGSDLLSSLFENIFGVPATDQEVPDEVPTEAYEYVAHPDYQVDGDAVDIAIDGGQRH